MKNFNELTDKALSTKLNSDYTRLAEGRQRFIFEKTLEILNEDGADIRAKRAEEARLRSAGVLKPGQELPSPGKDAAKAYRQTLDAVRQAGLEKLMDLSDKIGLTQQDMPWTPAMEPLSRAESLMKETDPKKYEELRNKLVQSLVQERKAAFDAGEQNISEKDLLSRVVGKNKDYAEALTRDEYESLSGGVTKPLRVETQDEQGNKVTQVDLPRWPGMSPGAAAAYDVGAGAADVLTDPVQLGTAVAGGAAFNVASRAIGAAGAKVATAVAARSPAAVKTAAKAAKPFIPGGLGRARNAEEVGRALGKASVAAAGGGMVASSGAEALQKGQFARWSGEMLGSLYPFLFGGRLADKTIKAYRETSSPKPTEAPKAKVAPPEAPKVSNEPKFEVPVEYRLSPEQMTDLGPLASAMREVPVDPFARITGNVRQGMPGSRVRRVGGGSEYVSPYNLTKKELARIERQGTTVEKEVVAGAKQRQFGRAIGGSVGERIASADTPFMKFVMDKYYNLQKALEVSPETTPSRGQIEQLAGTTEKPLQFKDYWKEYAKNIFPKPTLPSLPLIPSQTPSGEIQTTTGEIQTTKRRRRDTEAPKTPSETVKAPSETAKAPEIKADFNAPAEAPFAEFSLKPKPDYANTGEVLRAFGLSPEVFRATKGKQGGAFTARIPEAPKVEPKTTLSVSDVSAIERAGRPPESILSRAAREASAKPAEAPVAKPEVSPKPSEVGPEELSSVPWQIQRSSGRTPLAKAAGVVLAIPGTANLAVPQRSIADIFKTPKVAEVTPAVNVSIPKWAEMTREPLEVMNGDQIARAIFNMEPKMEAPKVIKSTPSAPPEILPEPSGAKPTQVKEPAKIDTNINVGQVSQTKVGAPAKQPVAPEEPLVIPSAPSPEAETLPEPSIPSSAPKETPNVKSVLASFGLTPAQSGKPSAQPVVPEQPLELPSGPSPEAERLEEPSRPSGVTRESPRLPAVSGPVGISKRPGEKPSAQPVSPEQPLELPSGPSPAAELLPEPSGPGKLPPRQTPIIPTVAAPSGLPKVEKEKPTTQPSTNISIQPKAPEIGAEYKTQEKPKETPSDEIGKKEPVQAPAIVTTPSIPQTPPNIPTPAIIAATILGSLPLFGGSDGKSPTLKAKGGGRGQGGIPNAPEEGFGDEGEADRDQPGMGTKDWNLLIKDIYSKYAGTFSK